jgi:putative endonuclease
MRSSTRSKKLGPESERRVRRHFLLRGYRILAANVWVAGNELDLVVRRGRRLVFCEVKAKTGEDFGDPFDMVDGEKARRVRRAAAVWLASRPHLAGCDVALEAVAVRGRRIERAPIE